MFLSWFMNPIVVGFINAFFLMFVNRISNAVYGVLSITVLIISGICSIFLILAHQNVDSMTESSPINRVQSSQRDSIVVNIIQCLIAVFLSSCILISRFNESSNSSDVYTEIVNSVD